MIDNTTIITDTFDKNVLLGYQDTEKNIFNVDNWKINNQKLSKSKICPNWNINWNVPNIASRLDKKQLLDKTETYIHLTIELKDYDRLLPLFNVIDILRKHTIVSLYTLSLIAYNLGNLKYNYKKNKINKEIKDWILDNENFYKVYSYVELYKCTGIIKQQKPDKEKREKIHKGGGEPSIPPALVQGYKYGATNANEEAILKIQHESNEQASMINPNNGSNAENTETNFKLIKGGGHTIPQFDVGNVEGPAGTQEGSINNAKLLLKAQENSRYDEFDPKDTHKGGNRKDKKKKHTRRKRMKNKNTTRRK